MPLNFFITGLPKAGKTTLLRTIIKELKGRGLYVGGFISPEEKHSGKRTGFMVQDIESGKTDVLASTGSGGPKVSKYHVEIASFESVAMLSLSDFSRYDVIIIDEIGPMETKSTVFLDGLDDILDSDTPIIASLHEDYVRRYAPLGTVFEIGETNRQQVYKDILAAIARIPKKSQREAMKHEEKMRKEKEYESAGKKPEKAGKRPMARAAKKPVLKKGKAESKPAMKKATPAKKKPGKAQKREEKKTKPGKKRGVVRKLRDLLGF